MICCVMCCIPASGLLKILKGHSFCKFPLLWSENLSQRENISKTEEAKCLDTCLSLCKRKFPIMEKGFSLLKKKKKCFTEKIYRGFPSLERNALQKIESASGDLSFFCFQSHLSVYMLFLKSVKCNLFNSSCKLGYFLVSKSLSVS